MRCAGINITRKTLFTGILLLIITFFLFFGIFDLAFAQVQGVNPDGPSQQVGTIRSLINRLLSLVNPLIALLFGFAVVGFVRGIAVFLWFAENEEKRKEGKKFIIWGITGLLIMTSFWGAVFIIRSLYFGPDDPGTPFNFLGQ